MGHLKYLVFIPATLVMLVLSGCVGTAALGVRAGTETLTALDEARAEIISRRQELRVKTRDLENIVINMHITAANKASVGGNFEAVEAAVKGGKAAIKAATPSIVKAIEEFDKIDQAIKKARAN